MDKTKSKIIIFTPERQINKIYKIKKNKLILLIQQDKEIRKLFKVILLIIIIQEL